MIARTPEHVSERTSGPAGEGFPQLLSPRRGPGGTRGSSQGRGRYGKEKKKEDGGDWEMGWEVGGTYMYF